MKVATLAIAAVALGLLAGTGVTALRARSAVEEAEADATTADVGTSLQTDSAGAGIHSDTVATDPIVPPPDSRGAVDSAQADQPAAAPNAVQPANKPSVVTPLGSDSSKGAGAVALDTTGTRRLGKIFSAMSPSDAAAVLAELDDREVQSILATFSDRQAAAVLASLSHERAATLSRAVLSGRDSGGR